MNLNEISLNSLRAFDAAARHLSFTRAGKELYVTQAAVSHQIKSLEAYLGKALFRRTARGLILTDEGIMLAPSVADAFARMTRTLTVLKRGGPNEILTISVVGTFAIGFLMERLSDFRLHHPTIELRLLTNNNIVDLFAESLNGAIRFGDGAWRSVQSDLLMRAPLSPLCSPAIAARLRGPDDLAAWPLLRSYRVQDWPEWFAAAGVTGVSARGSIFDASNVMVEAAILGEGIALAPPAMFRRELNDGRLSQPFATEVNVGAYWLTQLISKEVSPAMVAFREWLLAATSK